MIEHKKEALLDENKEDQHASNQTNTPAKPHLCHNKKCNNYKEIDIETSFCQECEKARQVGHFCFYCKQIYFIDYNDGDGWIECDICGKWLHTDCASKNEPIIDMSPQS